jgi:membrane protease YdiL (CAAX protease family)
MTSPVFRVIVATGAFLIVFPVVALVKHLTMPQMTILAHAGDELRYGSLLMLQAYVSYACLIIVAAALMRWEGLSHWEQRITGMQQLLGMPIGIVMGVGTWLLFWWFEGIPRAVDYHGYVGDPSRWVVLISMPAGALAGAAEELYYRGLLYRQSRRHMSIGEAQWANVALFVLWHTVEFKGLTHLAFVAVLGWVCVRLTENDGSYIRAAILHAILNVVFYVLVNVHVLLGRGA